MIPDLTRELAALEESVATVKALAIRARSRRQVRDDTEDISADLMRALRTTDSWTAKIRQRVEADPEASFHRVRN